MKKRKKTVLAVMLAAAIAVLGVFMYFSVLKQPEAELIPEETPEITQEPETEELTETTEELRYRLASSLMEKGEYRKAGIIFESFGDYMDSAELAEVCREEIYDAACRKMYRCEFETAAEDFEDLGDFKNSVNYLALCRERIELEGQVPERPALRPEEIDKDYGDAIMYMSENYMLYVPNECDENTAFFVFYPGGAVGEVYLPFQKVYDYVQKEHPNAVMYFCTTSGYGYYKTRNARVIDALKEIAFEKNIVVHNLVVCGASAGVYTAIHAASDYYTHAGIPVWKVVALDAAMEWEDPAKLTDEDLDIISANRTHMLLFEQPKVRDEKEQVHDMIEHDCYVTIVECREKAHNLIAYNSFKYGVFSYALEICDESGLKEGEYTFVNLNGE